MGIAKFFQEEIMDKDRVIGSAKQVKGAVKQARRLDNRRLTLATDVFVAYARSRPWPK